MERDNALGVRKGAWSKEEDALLKGCVDQFGEGRWHLVPLKTGLNRCRKSCRLRWLNYLRPNIKRGNFTEDEIDLLIRLHKLLGNRQVLDTMISFDEVQTPSWISNSWNHCACNYNTHDCLKWSLIAGRIPGRTANDVKNFWNTRMEKKSGGKGQENQEKITKANIIRPRPRNFSTLMVHDHPEARLAADHDHQSNNNNNNNISQPSSAVNASLSLSSEEADECIRWWSNLLDTAGDELEKDIPFVDDKGEEEGLWTGSNINPAGLMDYGSDLSMPPQELTDDLDYDDVWEFLG